MATKEPIISLGHLNCSNVNALLDKYLGSQCNSKRNHLRPCKDLEDHDCSCQHGPEGGKGCQEMKFPDIGPCVSISWGDSDCDCMETDDVEVFCITLCNCYSNVTFDDVVVGAIIVTDAAGNPVATLPDGTPSVQAIPIGPICFGSIGPCKDGRPACVSRQFAFRTRGAKGGLYQIHVGPICYSVTHHYQKDECFLITLCQD